METLLQDLRYGFRALRKSPGFTAVAVLTLALGIGANTAVFSVVDSFALRPLPVKDPSRLVYIYTSANTSRGQALDGDTSYPDLVDYRAAKSFEGVAGCDRRGMIAKIGDESASLPTSPVTANYFSLLGVSALYGRVFTEQDFRSGDTPQVVVVSYSLWRRLLGGDPHAVGRPITLNGRQFTVLGVLPNEFHGVDASFFVPDIFIPVEVWDRRDMMDRDYPHFGVVARLREGVDVGQARAEMDTLAEQLAVAYPKSRKGRVITVCSDWTCGGGGQKTNMRGEVTSGSLLLLIPLFVLLIAAANVAGLMLARAETRRREIATRMAVGASRARITRQLLTEGLLLAFAGLLLAMLIAIWCISAAPALLPASLQGSADFRLDFRAVGFACFVALLALLVFGVAPAWQLCRVPLVSELKEGGAMGAAPGRVWTRTVLIVGQIALSVVLLIGAGLMVRTFVNAQRQNLGFDSHGQVLLMEIAPWMGGDASERRFRQQYPEMLQHIEGIPGVQRASLATRAPLSDHGGGASKRIYVPGMQLPPGETGVPINYDVADGNYFEVLGTRLLLGRTFGEQDQPNSQRVAILNETAARRLWPNVPPVGQHLRFGGRDGQDMEVVGVVEDGKYTKVVEQIRPQMFVPYAQDSLGDTMLLVKTRVAPGSVVSAIRHAVREFDPGIAVFKTLTLDQNLRRALFTQRVMAQLVVVMGLLGLGLAVIGLYGVLAYYVNRSRHEIGVRIAIGAQPGAVFRMIVGKGFVLACIGVAIGLAGAVAAMRGLRGTFYGVSEHDPLTFAAVAVAIGLIAVVAAMIPASRAARVDPMVALRYE